MARSLLYRGYHLEQKQLMVGWQIAITRDDAQVHNGSILKDVDAAVAEARDHVDRLIAAGAP